MTTDHDDHIQTRDIPGAQVRRVSRDMDVVRIIREARLSNEHRAFALEYVCTAHVHDTRDELGGARLLQRVADETPSVVDHGNLRRTMERLATAFVHPDLRR